MKTQPPMETQNHKAAPFGYQWQDDTLVPDADEAPVRKLMYELFLKHRRKKTVARLLNEGGYRTRTGALFSDMAVDRLLRDPSAKGVYQFSGKNGRREKHNLREIAVEPIVPVDMWEQVNAVLNSSQKPGKRVAQLFAGLIYCQCGARMSVPSNSPKYICTDCRHKINTVDVEEIFQEQLQRISFSLDGDQNQTLSAYWQELTRTEKRFLIEQLVDRVNIGKTEIQITFYQLSPIKTVTEGQQLTTGQHDSDDVLAAKPVQEEQDRPPLLTEPLLNETQAAKFLGISRMTLLRKRNNGEIKFFRVGFRVLYSREKHLLPFLQGCESSPLKDR